jgi:hypothetical protein
MDKYRLTEGEVLWYNKNVAAIWAFYGVLESWSIGRVKTDTGEIEWGNQPYIPTIFSTLQYSSTPTFPCKRTGKVDWL